MIMSDSPKREPSQADRIAMALATVGVTAQTVADRVTEDALRGLASTTVRGLKWIDCLAAEGRRLNDEAE